MRAMLTQLAIETNTNNVKSLIYRSKKNMMRWKTKGHKYLLIHQSIKHLLTISGFLF